MAHTVAGVELPLKESAIDNDSPGAPYVGILVAEYAKAINYHCGRQWETLAPAEPVVRTYYARKPQEGDFKDADLPALYLYQAAVRNRRQFADSIQLKDVLLNLIWMPPPARDGVRHSRLEFWTAVDAAIETTMSPEEASLDTDAANWGTSLKVKADLWDLVLGGAQPTEIQIGSGEMARVYPAYAWEIVATLEYVHDTRTGPNAPPCTNTTYSVGPHGNQLVVVESHLVP